MSLRSRRIRRLALVGALTPLLSVLGLSGEAGSLPDQAAPAGDEHAFTHGPDGVDLDPRGRGRAGTPAGPLAVDLPAPWAPSEYDGRVFKTDQPDLTTLPAFHAVYIHPADQPSRFGRYAAMFQADARDASRLLSDLYGRGIRFDERAAADGSRYLDITVVKSRYKARQLTGANQFGLVAGELAARGFDRPGKKYAVWLDAGSQACGQGHLNHDTRRSADNANDGTTTAVVYRPYPADDANGGFCRGRTLRHELGHNMGALQQVAPNAFDGAHCDDSAEDTMCYPSSSTPDTGAAAFDHGNDDYWDPAAAGGTGTLPWWTVNLSAYVCPVGGDCTAANDPDF